MTLAPGLYGIADTTFGDPLTLGLALADGGARVIQLRAKDWTTAQRVAACRALVEHLRPRGVRLVMNDDLLAAEHGHADGLHLGQDDGSLSTARAILGPDALLGRSTHNLEHVRRVDREADYIGFGPVFHTQTKRAAGHARGLDSLREAVAESVLPVVAIGGIRHAHLPAVRATGARHWAVISDILGHPDISARARQFGPLAE